MGKVERVYIRLYKRYAREEKREFEKTEEAEKTKEAEKTEEAEKESTEGYFWRAALIDFFGKNGVKSAHIFAFVCVDAGVGQRGIFVAFELIDCIVHEFSVEDTEGDEEVKVGQGQPCHLAEQFGFKLVNHIVKRVLTVVRQIHENRDSGGEFDEFFLYLFTH